MSDNYGSTQNLDVTADGGAESISLTPGASVVTGEFTVQAPKGGVDRNWPLCTCAVVKTSIVIDQPASGGSAINADDLPVMFDGYDGNSNLLGNIWPHDTFTGPIAKHLVEFISEGYQNPDGARVQIASSDGDNTVVYYQCLPFSHRAFEKSHHFAHWIGWLNALKIKIFLAPSTAIAGVSTGAVTKTPCTVRCWLEYVVSNELIMPPFNQWHLYESPATGGNTVTVQGIGTENGMNDVKGGSRLAGLFELTSVGNMGGEDDADNITGISIPQLGYDLTVNPDAYFLAFKRTMQGHRGPIAISASAPVVDRNGDPYTMAGSVLGSLNANTALYNPLRWPALSDAQISKVVKFGPGDLKIVHTYTTPPSSGKHRVVTNELREYGEGKKAEMIGKTGKRGKLERIYSNGMPDPQDVARHPGVHACLPERVIFT